MKGKRYILVEVDVDIVADEAGYGSLPNNLTSDSQQSLDSLCAEIERTGYADGTRVYGVQQVHVFHIPEIVLDALHHSACKKVIGGLGKECDKPDRPHDMVKTTALLTRSSGGDS